MVGHRNMRFFQIPHHFSMSLDCYFDDVYEVSTVSGPKMVATKRFIARQVGANDPQGAGVRVFRVALSE